VLGGHVVAALFAAYGFLYGFLKSDDAVAEGAGALLRCKAGNR
jgi:hypothetical protein